MSEQAWWRCQHTETFNTVWLPYKPVGPYDCVPFVRKSDYDALHAEAEVLDVLCQSRFDEIAQLKAEAEALRAALSAQQSASPEFCCELSYKAAKQKAWDARLIERCKCDHNEYCERCWPADFRPAGKWHGGFVAQQSAHVSVPRELLEDLRDCANECYNHARLRGTSGLDNYERLTEEADALINGGEA